MNYFILLWSLLSISEQLFLHLVIFPVFASLLFLTSVFVSPLACWIVRRHGHPFHGHCSLLLPNLPFIQLPQENFSPPTSHPPGRNQIGSMTIAISGTPKRGRIKWAHVSNCPWRLSQYTGCWMWIADQMAMGTWTVTEPSTRVRERHAPWGGWEGAKRGGVKLGVWP